MSEGKKIREFREKRNLSITDLATRVGVSRSYMSRMESGDRPIKTEILNKISNVLDVPIQDFYSESQKKIIKHREQEIIVIDKKKHDLGNFTEEEILEFIRIGKEKSDNNV